jgi:hypothetical protein
MSTLTVPVRIAVVAGPVFLSHLSFWVSLLLAIAVLMLQLEHFHFDTPISDSGACQHCIYRSQATCWNTRKNQMKPTWVHIVERYF